MALIEQYDVVVLKDGSWIMQVKYNQKTAKEEFDRCTKQLENYGFPVKLTGEKND